MVLNVTSDCEKPIEIGFASGNITDLVDSFLLYAPANTKGSKITARDEWKRWNQRNLTLESRTSCPGKSLTIHDIQFVKGPENCFSRGMLYDVIKFPFQIRPDIM